MIVSVSNQLAEVFTFKPARLHNGLLVPTVRVNWVFQRFFRLPCDKYLVFFGGKAVGCSMTGTTFTLTAPELARVDTFEQVNEMSKQMSEV